MTLFACAPSRTPEQEMFLHQLADRPVTCVSGEDCASKWSKAIRWVSDHSKKGLKTLTENMIQTYSASDGEHPPQRYPEFTVLRYPRGNMNVIDFDSYCGHGFVCNPSALKLKADFVTFVLGVPPGVAEVQPGVFQKKLPQ